MERTKKNFTIPINVHHGASPETIKEIESWPIYGEKPKRTMKRTKLSSSVIDIPKILIRYCLYKPYCIEIIFIYVTLKQLFIRQRVLNSIDTDKYIMELGKMKKRTYLRANKRLKQYMEDLNLNYN